MIPHRALELFIHHGIGDDLEDSLIASAAAGGAMSGLFDVLENVKKIFDLRVLFKSIKDVEVGYVFAVAYLEILYGLAIYGFEITGFVFRHFLILRVLFY